MSCDQEALLSNQGRSSIYKSKIKVPVITKKIINAYI